MRRSTNSIRKPARCKVYHGSQCLVWDEVVPTTVLQALRHPNTRLPAAPKSGVGGRPSVGTKRKIVSQDDAIKNQPRMMNAPDRSAVPSAGDVMTVKTSLR